MIKYQVPISHNLIRINLPKGILAYNLEALSTAYGYQAIRRFILSVKKELAQGSIFLTCAKERKMARNLNYIYALVEYVENTAGYIFRVFETWEEAKATKETLLLYKNRYEPQRKVSYVIEIYKKGS